MYDQRKMMEAKVHARRGLKPLVATLIVSVSLLAPTAAAYAGTWTRH